MMIMMVDGDDEGYDKDDDDDDDDDDINISIYKSITVHSVRHTWI